jgi:hypothetical protein
MFEQLQAPDHLSLIPFEIYSFCFNLIIKKQIEHLQENEALGLFLLSATTQLGPHFLLSASETKRLSKRGTLRTASKDTAVVVGGKAAKAGDAPAPAVVSAGPVAATQPLVLKPSSSVYTIYARHRLVFSLDISPSVASLTPSGSVLYEHFYTVLERCFLELIKPIVFPALNVEVRTPAYVCMRTRSQLT